MVTQWTDAGMTSHAKGEYGPLFFLIEMMGITPHELAHKSDELMFYKKGK